MAARLRSAIRSGPRGRGSSARSSTSFGAGAAVWAAPRSARAAARATLSSSRSTGSSPLSNRRAPRAPLLQSPPVGEEGRLTRRRLIGTAATGAAAAALDRAPLVAGARHRPGRARADVVVVGAGFAGLTAALKLKHAGRSVI